MKIEHIRIDFIRIKMDDDEKFRDEPVFKFEIRVRFQETMQILHHQCSFSINDDYEILVSEAMDGAKNSFIKAVEEYELEKKT